MPTYSYACTECDNRFDAVQAFTDDALTECPKCAGRVRKLFNSVGVVFKGSGFYRTDSRESGKPTKNGSDSGGSDKPSAAKASSPEKSPAKDGTSSSASGSATSGSSAPAAASS